MPSYLHPGVYIEEIPSGSRPIEGVATSVAAFVGTTFRGPANDPVLIQNWDDYVAQFGDYGQSTGISSEQDDTALAVRAFYANGGRAAYICRITAENPKSATTTFKDSASKNSVVISASSEGTWANVLYILITAGPVATSFNLAVGVREGADFTALPNEEYTNLNLEPSDDNYAEKVVNGASRLITLTLHADNEKVPKITDVKGAKLSGGIVGAAGDPDADDYASFYNSTLRKVRDVSIMLLPGQQWTADSTGNDFINNTLVHCESTMSRVLIVDPPADTELESAKDVTDMALPTSTYSVLYYPWVTINNPLYHADRNPSAAPQLQIPPSSIAAAMWAKIDGKRGVWKAPAGVEARVAVNGLQYKVEDQEQDFLNPLGVNCIRTRQSYGPVVWGARTLATKADPEWRYVPVRRTAIYLEQSIYNGIQWAVFEPNDHPLWSSLRANIGSFMNGMFRSGAFQGATSNDAYFVRCGLGDSMTQGDIDRGQVIIVVGFAPLKPAEFVILRIQQKVGQQ